MTPFLSQRQFARLVGVSQQAVNKAIRAGNVHDDGHGIDPEHPVNAAYAERQAERAAEENRPLTPWELSNATPGDGDSNADTSSDTGAAVDGDEAALLGAQLAATCGATEHMTQTAFAKLARTSQATISRALSTGRLVWSTDPHTARHVIDPEHPVNLAFLLNRGVDPRPPAPTPRPLAERLAALPPVERQILELLLSRLEMGLDDYGAWPPPEEERRDLEREMLEEAVDFVAYGAAALLRVRAGGAP